MKRKTYVVLVVKDMNGAIKKVETADENPTVILQATRRISSFWGLPVSPENNRPKRPRRRRFVDARPGKIIRAQPGKPLIIEDVETKRRYSYDWV